MSIQSTLICGFLFLGGLLMQGFDLISELGALFSICGSIALLIALFKEIIRDLKSDNNKEDSHEDS